MASVIISYSNPDLDGVACAVALEVLERPRWTARVLGAADPETRFVMNALDLPLPPSLHDWSGVKAIWLVDTHHPKQLPDDLPSDIVMRIIDHHPGGSPQSYARADIQNEIVGAAATLVAERFVERGVEVPSNVAVLLQCAIMSNTLEFRAPATSPRDRHAYEWLARIRQVDVAVLEGMRRTRREKMTLGTGALLESDAKIFETLHGSVIVAQVEAPGALELLARADLISSLRLFADSRNAACGILNVVDTEVGKSAVLGTDEKIVRMLSVGLHEKADDDGIVRIDRLLQRKTDIIPFLLR